MNGFEKEVIERLARIEERLTNDYHAIHGNGKPGILETVENITHRVTVLETAAKAEKNHHGMIAVVIAWIVNAAIAIYAAFKNQP